MTRYKKKQSPKRFQNRILVLTVKVFFRSIFFNKNQEKLAKIKLAKNSNRKGTKEQQFLEYSALNSLI